MAAFASHPLWGALSALALCVVLAACGPAEQEGAATHTANVPAAPAPDAPQHSPVEVAEQGELFDPPVSVAELPSGVYFCDMGTVHYARHLDTGEPCPVCGMALTHLGDDVTQHGGH